MLIESTSLVILYTAALNGRLEFLPKLMTRIRQERAAALGPTVLVDLGKSCAAGTWICDTTDGRGMLVAMDAMGYDAFHIGSADPLYTQPGIVQGLRSVLNTPIAAGPWDGVSRRKGLVISLSARVDQRPQLAEPADLHIVLQLGKYERADVDFDGQTRLLMLDGGWTDNEILLGKLDVALLPDDPYIRVVSQSRLDLPTNLMPDPSITGIIEFVESEAHQAERKRGTLD
jgi:hypothetical protein